MTCLDDQCLFLPGVPTSYVRERLEKADGHELTSGKFASKESSAALAVNTFGWFHDRPDRLPRFPILGQPTLCAIRVEVEYCARFPWSGGTHPWLDAFVETPDAVIGVESKRFEPFRGGKAVDFSPAYSRDWGKAMAAYEAMRDNLRSGIERFEFLDAAQLVKHAFGLVTEGGRKKKRPYLVYLFAEPQEHAAKWQPHRQEIECFAKAVARAEVTFGASSYREWLDSWPAVDLGIAKHRAAIIERFHP